MPHLKSKFGFQICFRSRIRRAGRAPSCGFAGSRGVRAPTPNAPQPISTSAFEPPGRHVSRLSLWSGPSQCRDPQCSREHVRRWSGFSYSARRFPSYCTVRVTDSLARVGYRLPLIRSRAPPRNLALQCTDAHIRYSPMDYFRPATINACACASIRSGSGSVLPILSLITSRGPECRVVGTAESDVMATAMSLCLDVWDRRDRGQRPATCMTF